MAAPRDSIHASTGLNRLVRERPPRPKKATGKTEGSDKEKADTSGTDTGSGRQNSRASPHEAQASQPTARPTPRLAQGRDLTKEAGNHEFSTKRVQPRYTMPPKPPKSPLSRLVL